MDNMTSLRLGEAFLVRAKARLEALDALKDEAEPFDVIREARDIVDLGFRSMLRVVGVEMPRWRDVGEVLQEHIARFPADVRLQREKLLAVMEGLSDHQPEDGDLKPADLIIEAERATADAEWVVELARLNVEMVAHNRVPAASIR